MEILIIFAIAIVSIFFAFLFIKNVMKRSTGTEAMQKISNAIKLGAEAYLRRQNRTIFFLAIVVAALVYLLYIVQNKPQLAMWASMSFVLGAICSVASGYIGMWISIRANIRTASEATHSLNGALQTALRAGAVTGIFVVALSILGVSGLFYLAYSLGQFDTVRIPLYIAGYGFGASFVALFAQLGGGIYTKAADVGADLVGKVEAGIPEDDPRNPAVIADLVGDNVGDCAGRGADLFESTAAENIGAMILATLLYSSNPAIFGNNPAALLAIILFPLITMAFGLVSSIIGIISVKAKEDGDPMDALNRGYYLTATLVLIGLGVISYWTFGRGSIAAGAPDAWWHFLLCGVIGTITSLLFLWITQYYTEYKYKPVQSIAESSITGPATNIISGLAIGFECVALPALVISAAIIGSYSLGVTSGFENAGFFGTAVATIGMLGPAAYILAMDTFGPITDNAGGIVEMSQQPDNVRRITDRLDAVGNTTKALTKGYAVGSAALAAFLLFAAFIVELQEYGLRLTSVDITKPAVFVGGLLGAMIVFLFTSMAIKAVGRAAQSVISNVREQFRNKPGILAGTDTPDYAQTVDIVTKSALKEMVKPGLLVLLAPVVVGVIFKMLFWARVNGNEAIRPLADAFRSAGTPEEKINIMKQILTTVPSLVPGAEVVASMLLIGTITGVLMALFLNNGGGAWDNAKKFIELEPRNLEKNTGKGSDKHKAAVVGDTVGDPFKDTAGPSLHILIKLLSTITLVLAPLFI